MAGTTEATIVNGARRGEWTVETPSGKRATIIKQETALYGLGASDGVWDFCVQWPGGIVIEHYATFEDAVQGVVDGPL
jgi:hypothetical protein